MGSIFDVWLRSEYASDNFKNITNKAFWQLLVDMIVCPLKS